MSECIPDFEKDVFIQGGDYRSVFVPDVEYCQLVCTLSPRCLMFSYLPGTWIRQNDKYVCYLKDSATDTLPRVSLPGVISGYSLKNCNKELNACWTTVYPEIDMRGTNFNSTKVTSLKQCQTECTNDIHCQFFTYVTDEFHNVELRNFCYFKYSSWGLPTMIQHMHNVISGFSLKFCGSSTYGCQRDLFQNVEFIGKHLTSVFAPDFNMCQKICSFFPNCLFFTFLKKEWQDPSQRYLCHLKTSKSGTPEIITKDHTVSGFSLLTCKSRLSVCPLPLYKDVDFDGTDILMQVVEGEEECQGLCSKITRCQFFTYKPIQSSCVLNKCKCHLKMSSNGSPTGIRHRQGGVSGYSLRLCQSRVISGKIMLNFVGGDESSLGEWPWQVSMHLKLTTRSEQHACGGSIINKQWMVTAAHCVFHFNKPSLWNIYGGFVNLSELNLTTPFFEVEQIIIHSLYDATDISNDIALLKLKRPVLSTDNILPICLPPKENQLVIPDYCWVTGWGYTEETGNSSNFLQKAKLPILSTEQCQTKYLSKKIDNDVVCAGYEHGTIDACKGDSGGPLTCQIDKTWYLIGITSWGEGCARAGKPGVYTRVSSYIDWIHENSLQNFY
uniref:Coagulation factor XI n=1 Tax=Leptobrachium leishanense TaxID=445787 RepID=A0A8C5LLU1_9ANUR